MLTEPLETSYQCPGETYPIGRSVHLARLASFYPKCRDCVHRGDTGTHSLRLVRLLDRTWQRPRERSIFTDEGVRGVYLNTLTAPQARELAAAFALGLPSDCSGEAGLTDDVIVAGDGRPLTSELVAAACDGVQWTNRRVIDLGAATAPFVVWAVRHLRAAGGLLVGNAGDEPQMIGIKFWGREGRPFSAPWDLDCMRQLCDAKVDRPSRSYGSLARFRADDGYLAGWRDHFHALRPLRFVLDTSCRPLAVYLRALMVECACEVMQDEPLGCQATTRRGLAERVRRSESHFGLWIDGDGEACRLFDQGGLEVRHDEWLWLTAKFLLERHPSAAFVVEHGTSTHLAKQISAVGGRVHFSSPERAAMHDAMQEHGAQAGGGPSGRLWFGEQAPVPDALKALALLLTILSQSDLPLGERLKEG
jgi:phosphomannomutase